MADDDILQQLQGQPQPQSRWDVLYNNLVPSWLKDTPPSPMPPEGTTPGKIGPPSGPPSLGTLSPDTLPEALSWLAPGGKAAAMAGKEVIPAIMAGLKAKTANMSDYSLATAMGSKGFPKEQIHDATKWFLGADEQPRFEISDREARGRPLPAGIGDSGIQGSVAGFLHHPELFKAYPDIKNVTVHISPNYGNEKVGEYQPWANKIIVGGPARATGLTDDQMSTLLHELQHSVQAKENFSPGTNPEYAYHTVKEELWNKFNKMPGTHPDADKVYDGLNKILQHGPSLGHEMYRRQPGEVEARNVTSRWLRGGHLYAGWPELYPWQTEDVPRSKQFQYVKRK